MAEIKLIGRKRKFVREEKPEKIFREMTRHHVDVLENIEFSIIEAWQHNSIIDDKIVASALKTIIQGGQPVNKLTSSLIKDIEYVRMIRSDVSDEIWTKGLKVVLESVHNHSFARTGDREYLEFVSEFIH